MNLKDQIRLLAAADDAEKFFARAKEKGFAVERRSYLVGYWLSFSEHYGRPDTTNLDLSLFAAKLAGGIAGRGLDNNGLAKVDPSIPTYDSSLAVLREYVAKAERAA